MGKRINLRQYWAKKAAQGRMGDSEMRVVKGEAAHVNPVEADIIDRHGKVGEEIVSRVGSGTINPKTGHKEYIPPWLITAGIQAAGSLIKGGIQRKQQKDLIAKQKQVGLRQLDAAGQISGEEAAAMARMKKGAEEGTMDVDALNQQMAQPLYQQGQAQQATQMGQMTMQGLEGSIIAQEASRKVGADVRASIASQARQIAYANEQTKAGAERSYQDALTRRGQLLRNIAAKRMGVIGESEIAELESQQAWNASLLNTGVGLVSGLGAQAGGGPVGEAFGAFMQGVNQQYTPQSGTSQSGGGYGGIPVEDILNLWMQQNQNQNNLLYPEGGAQGPPLQTK